MAISSMFLQLNDSILSDPLNKEYDFGVEGEPHSRMDNIDPRMKSVANGLLGGVGAATGRPVAPLQTSQEKVAARKADHRKVLAQQASSLGLDSLAQSILSGDMDNKDALDAIQAHKDAEAEKAAVDLEHKRDTESAKLIADAEVAKQAQEHANAMEILGVELAGELEVIAAEHQSDNGGLTPEGLKVWEDTVKNSEDWGSIGPEGNLGEIKVMTPGGEPSTAVAVYNRNLNEDINEGNALYNEIGRHLGALMALPEDAWKPGVGGLIEEKVKDWTGAQDSVSEIVKQGAALRAKVAIANLPVGPASDKDIALVLSGTMNPLANRETLISYYEGVQKLKALSLYELDFKSRYAGATGDISAGNMRWRNHRVKAFPGIFGSKAQRDQATVSKAILKKKGITISAEEALRLKGLDRGDDGSVAPIFATTRKGQYGGGR